MGPNYNLIDKWTSDSAIWFRVLQLPVYSSADSRTRRLIDGDSNNHCIIKDNQCNFEQFDFVSDVWVRSCPASSVSLSHALDSIEFGQFCHSRRGFGYPPLLSICFVCNLDFKQGFLNKCSLSIHLLLLPPQQWCFGLPSFYGSASPKLTCNNFLPQVKTHIKLLCLGSSQLGVFCPTSYCGNCFRREPFRFGKLTWAGKSHLKVIVNWSCLSGLSQTATTLGSVWLILQLSYSSLLTL